MKKIILSVLVLAIASVVAWYFTSNGAQKQSYRLVTVERGDLEETVASTGNLEAVTTVEVGTQVSGIISAIFVDFNDYVKKGQVIAKIDTTLLALALQDAEANLERNRADLKNAQREYDRIKGLYDKGFASDADFNAAELSLDVARATMKSAELSVTRAKQNLSYATIYAPISGTVIERDVDVGQTVAASLSAPRLFLIAADLSKMQILASVDESDIGQIKSGQEARFTVQAYPDDKFTGTVRQVRLNSTVEENVVTYTVVVDVNNPDRKLLPGMTATIDFVIQTTTDVFKVPNAALRFRATEAMMAEVRERRQQQREQRAASGDSTRTRRWGGGMGNATGERPSNMTMLWYVDADGKVAATPVRTGITDGQSTEISGRNLSDGMQVIAGITTGTQAASSNPFSSSQQGRRRGPPGMF
jgi:HlyD family secretion protein